MHYSSGSLGLLLLVGGVPRWGSLGMQLILLHGCERESRVAQSLDTPLLSVLFGFCVIHLEN